MKTMIKILVLTFVSIFGLQSCEKNDEVVSTTNLPAAAQTFIAAHYPDTSVLKVVKDYDDKSYSYKVSLSDGTYIEFNKSGEWREVENYATGVPEAILPAKILEYLQVNFADTFVVEIELGRYYYVELNSGLELVFSTAGDYITVDM